MKDNKGLYLTLVVIAVVFAGVIFGGRLLREEIAVGQTVSNDERPAEWNMIIAQEINSRGIQLVLDGKEREVSKGQIIMNSDNQIMLDENLFTKDFQCAFACIDESSIIIMKGSARADIEIGTDFMTVGENVSQIKNAAQIIDGDAYVQAEVLEKAFGYGYKKKGLDD